jgi:hypothetical protein
MKMILYVFAIGWFLAGLVALLGGQPFWLGPAQQALPPASTTLGITAIGWEWIWTFPMPALLAGALAAVLGRLDEVRDAIEYSHEQRDDDDELPHEPEERVDPYIGEGFLTGAANPDANSDSSRRNHSRS